MPRAGVYWPRTPGITGAPTRDAARRGLASSLEGYKELFRRALRWALAC